MTATEAMVEARQMLIAGEWVSASNGATQTTSDPALSVEMATVPDATREDVNRAVEASRAALTSADWAGMDPGQRARVLQKLAALTYAQSKALAAIESQNNGKTFREALSDIRFAAATIEYHAGWADKVGGRTIAVPGPRLGYTLRQPLGVTAHIAPWNFPLQLAIRSIAPALATGCTIIAKPASLTPLSLLAWAPLVEEAGVPAGVFQVITGRGSVCGDALARHPGIDGIAFTGGVETGRQILRASADNIAATALELGGKGANVVFADADIRRATKAICFGIYMNAGQMCWAGSRLLVHGDVHDELVESVIAEVRTWPIGPGMEQGVRIGSMVSQGQRDEVLGMVEEGLAQGGKLVAGGGPATGEGLEAGAFVLPTVITDIENDNLLVQQEIFGPVLTVQRFSTPEEALRLANSTPYGLLNGVWTQNLGLAHSMARDLESGMVSVNEFPITFPQTPFTGWGDSGIGAEQGEEALHFYTKTKNVNVRLD